LQEDKDDGYLEPSAAKLELWNQMNAQNTRNILVICVPNNSLGTEGINEGLQRQQDR